jgi:hypothetical protein
MQDLKDYIRIRWILETEGPLQRYYRKQAGRFIEVYLRNTNTTMRSALSCCPAVSPGMGGAGAARRRASGDRRCAAEKASEAGKPGEEPGRRRPAG